MAKASTAGLFLGVLCGGLSQRMGQDKVLLEYHLGFNQKEFCRNLGAQLKLPTFFSVNQKQFHQWDYPCIPDHWPECGPIGGIASLLQSTEVSNPATAWLVIACDMPDLNKKILSNLLYKRRLEYKATVYRSQSGLEPLCAIYEPRILPDMKQAILTGHYGMRQLLENLHNDIYSISVKSNMLNLNTPEELQKYQDNS